jgi:uncharacterized membrane protein
MVTFLIYILIVLATVTQSASTKAFNKQSSNSGVFNALKASSALLMFALMAIPGFTLHLPTILFGLAYGAGLCLSMYAGYKALCLGPMALSSMLVSFSVIIPLVWGLTFGDEKLSLLQCIAFVLLLFALISTNADKLRAGSIKGTSYGLWLTFVGITFLCNGTCSILQKQHQTLYPEAYGREFMFFAMLLCSVIFISVTLARTSFSEIKKTKGKLFGVLSGLSNGMANFMTLTLAGFENASILFPIISAGTILAALLCGRVVFKEKLKVNHYVALAIGIVSIVLLKL